MPIEVMVEDESWAALALGSRAEAAFAVVLEYAGLDPGTAVASLLATSDAEIATLNAMFRDAQRATNVLSWPAHELVPPDLPDADFDGSVELGDLALAYATCRREAAEQGKPLEDHATHLIVHGLLHLLGYDHVSETEATRMESLEIKLLGKLGVSDPYS